MRTEPVKENSKRNIVVVLFITLVIAILGGSIYMGHKQEQQKQIAKEHALYKHGFRLLEEQLATYIKEHYEGVSKIEFSPIYEDGGDGYSMHTLNIVPVIYDKFGNRVVMKRKMNESFGIGQGLSLDFSGADESEIIELDNYDKDEVIDVSNYKHLPDKAKLESYQILDDLIEYLVQSGQLKDVKKSDKGSPEASVKYNLEIKKGSYNEWR